MDNQRYYIPNYKNPFGFFDALVEHINSSTDISIVLQFGYIFSDIENINFKTRIITTLEPIIDITGYMIDKAKIEHTFTYYCDFHISCQADRAFYDIDEYIHGKNTDLIKPYLTIQFNSLISIKNRYKETITKKENYPVFSETLRKLENQFIDKYGSFIEQPVSLLPHNDNKKKVANYSNLTPIKWNLGPAVLGTMISDLWNLQHSGKPVMEASLPQLVSFVLSNFTNEKGDPFSADSIKDYIDKKKIKTKAKRIRIELKTGN